MTHRERPRTVDAHHFEGDRDALFTWLDASCLISDAIGGGVVLHLREETLVVREGEWVVKGPYGITTIGPVDFGRRFEPAP